MRRTGTGELMKKSEAAVNEEMLDILVGVGIDSWNRMDKFIEIAPKLPGPQYWKGLGIAWTGADNTYRYKDVVKSLFLSEMPYRYYLMTPGERRYLKSLPERIIIYRAMTKDEYKKKEYGISWTLDPKTAQFFMTNYRRNFAAANQPKVIHTMTINKSNIIAFFDDRKEKEIIYVHNTSEGLA